MKGFLLDLNTIPVREITCILYFSRWMEMNKPVGFIATFSLQKGGGVDVSGFFTNICSLDT